MLDVYTRNLAPKYPKSMRDSIGEEIYNKIIELNDGKDFDGLYIFVSVVPYHPTFD